MRRVGNEKKKKQETVSNFKKVDAGKLTHGHAETGQKKQNLHAIQLGQARKLIFNSNFQSSCLIWDFLNFLYNLIFFFFAICFKSFQIVPITR